MFVFQLLDKLEDHEIDVVWFTKSKMRHSVKALPWNLPWYVYFKRVVFLDLYYDEKEKPYWLCEVK